jgi:hypothetical protein
VSERRVLFAGDVHLHPARPKVTERFERLPRGGGPGRRRAVRARGSLRPLGLPAPGRDPVLRARPRAARRRRETDRRGVLPPRQPGLPAPAGASGEGGALPAAPLARDPAGRRERPHPARRPALHPRPGVSEDARAAAAAVRDVALAGGASRRGVEDGEGLRGVSRKAVAAKPASIDGLAPEAIRHRFRTSSRRDVIVCGHVHRPENRELVVDGRPRRLVVIPAWDEGGGWAEWREGHWRLRETGS